MPNISYKLELHFDKKTGQVSSIYPLPIVICMSEWCSLSYRAINFTPKTLAAQYWSPAQTLANYIMLSWLPSTGAWLR